MSKYFFGHFLVKNQKNLPISQKKMYIYSIMLYQTLNLRGICSAGVASHP